MKWVYNGYEHRLSFLRCLKLATAKRRLGGGNEYDRCRSVGFTHCSVWRSTVFCRFTAAAVQEHKQSTRLRGVRHRTGAVDVPAHRYCSLPTMQNGVYHTENRTGRAFVLCVMQGFDLRGCGYRACRYFACNRMNDAV